MKRRRGLIARWRLPRASKAYDAATNAGELRVCREVATERNLFNAAGTFYELPASNAGGFAKIRPLSTHGRRIHDFASYRGLLVFSGVLPNAPATDHIIRSTDHQCALWVGAVDDVWQFGKPRGQGGPWHDTTVAANAPSDAYLATGYDQKRLTLTGSKSAKVRVEADFTCGGDWSTVTTLEVTPGKPTEYKFPAAFGAYWLRVISDTDSTMTATFSYE